MAGLAAVDEIITHILAARSCWSALGIALSSKPTLEDVQKQYRRLALAVHPDKCSQVLRARRCLRRG
jgi:DnaJ-class molecular chaperone